MIRNTLNLVMLLCILAVMDYRFTGNAVHEILGVVILLLFTGHNALNRRWYKTIGRGKTSLLRILQSIVNFLLLAVMVTVTVTGVLISQTVFPAFSLSGNLWIHELHTLSAYSGLILSAIHLGFHWNALWGKLCRWLGIERTAYSYILLSRAASLVIVGYGIYASFTRQIGSKLLLQHVSIGWGAAPPSIAGFIFDYTAIMGCYAAAAYYLTQILQKTELQKYRA